MNRREFTRAAAALALPSALAGCSGTKVVPVSGRVLIEGKPLAMGVVQVAPAGYRAAQGIINPDGTSTLGTNSKDDGVVLGTHPAAVIAHKTLGPCATEWLAPKKYISTETSKLTVTIDGPTNDLTINLTWDGGKPFVVRYDKE